MNRYLLAELRGRMGRVLALGLGVMLAAVAFTVLLGTAKVSQLRTVGVVKKNFRSAYDILVRPPASQTALERQTGLVQNNFLSGIYGGITLRQYRAVRAVPGVAVAAPIAMVGYVLPTVNIPLDLTGQLTGATRQLFRVDATWTTDRRLSRVRDLPSFLYVTRQPLVFDGRGPFSIRETTPTGRPVVVCPAEAWRTGGKSPFAAQPRSQLECWSRSNGYQGLGPRASTFPREHVGINIRWPFPLLLAAMDPVQEAKLAGVPGAVISGRYLRTSDSPGIRQRSYGPQHFLPVLASSRSFDDEQLRLTARPVAPATAARMAQGLNVTALRRMLTSAPLGATVAVQATSSGQAYRRLMRDPGQIDGYWSPGPVGYQLRGRQDFAAQTKVNPPGVWTSQGQGEGFVVAPTDAGDTGFRRLTQHQSVASASSAGFAALQVVGQFDPGRLPGFNALSAVPMETYNPPVATGADSLSRRLLGGRPLLPNGNLAGYLQQPPTLLTTLAALPTLSSSSSFTGVRTGAPISVIRVRVSGVHGPDPVSRERVRVAAEQIEHSTGLTVDITLGSSPTTVRVALPAGRFGRPPLALSEGWTRKGVTVAILNAVDRKSLGLFALILVVCVAFTGNAANAAVRSRRHELGVLRCLGWGRSKLAALVVIELAGAGAAAGAAGTLLALPLAAALNVHVSWWRSTLVIPVAVLVASLAGLLPVLRAVRTSPLAATQPAVVTPRRALSGRSLPALAWANVLRLPGRTLVAGLALAVGVGGLTTLLAITTAFRGVLVSSVLGQAVAVQVRGVDYLALTIVLLLAVASVTDVLYLNLQERTAEFATLHAVGWDESTMRWLVALEGTLIGVAGSLTGAGIGIALALLLTRSGTGGLILAAALAASAGTLLTAASSIIPAARLRRLPTPMLLANE